MKRTSHCIDFTRAGSTPADPKLIALFKINTRCPLDTDEVRDLFFNTLRHWLSSRDGFKALSNFDGDFTLWEFPVLSGNASLRSAFSAVGITKVQVYVHASHASGDTGDVHYSRPSSLAA